MSGFYVIMQIVSLSREGLQERLKDEKLTLTTLDLKQH